MPQARHFKNNIKWKETVVLGDLDGILKYKKKVKEMYTTHTSQ